MIILGIESSCDETAFALLKADARGFIIEKQVISSQIAIHAAYGGVIPEVAARQHVDVLFPLLKELGIHHTGAGIDAIAVTSGPGLVAALRVGVELAKTLAWVWKKPLVGVNHLAGHIASVWIEQPAPTFPLLALLVSGGHTELILMKEQGSYELIGKTRDDAAGEAFDKTAKLLGLAYPGGPKISALAKEGNRQAIAFPRPMLESDNLDFSFSGLKTAVAVYLKDHPDTPVADVCASFEQAVIDVLVQKTLRAVKETHVTTVTLSGGVSANTYLRETLRSSLAQTFPNIHFAVPLLKYTTDNAAMIAQAGYFMLQQGKMTDPLVLMADPNANL